MPKVATPPQPFVRLEDFAQDHAQGSGIELMGGFVYDMQTKNKLADTVENYRLALSEFSKRKLG